MKTQTKMLGMGLLTAACAPSHPGPIVMPWQCETGVPIGVKASGETALRSWRTTDMATPAWYLTPPAFEPYIDESTGYSIGFTSCAVGHDVGWRFGAAFWDLPADRPLVMTPDVGNPSASPNFVVGLMRCADRECSYLWPDTTDSPLYGCLKKRAEIREYSKEAGRLDVTIHLEFSGGRRAEMDLNLTWDPAQVPPSRYPNRAAGAGGAGGTTGSPLAGAGGL